MAVTGLKWCDFVVWTPEDLFIERIPFDQSLWTNFMLPKLNAFFAQCVLPELVDPVYPKKEIVDRNLTGTGNQSQCP